ncbi:MAG: alpha/beta hydrolase, partial [Actinomycetota bacterium]|nr:alpha/beta hydrolase [Actinomycetota bacterium]
DATKGFDQGCKTMSGTIAPFVGTDNAARDMDLIRQAVGDAKLTYVGFSYGTFLGATYAKLFPTHIRAMVLDGAENPALDPVTFQTSQSVAFEKQLDAFFAFCSVTPTCAWKPAGDPHGAYQALMARLVSQPLPGVGARTLGPGEALTGVTATLYDQASWPVLGVALQRASTGDGSILLKLGDLYNGRMRDGTYTNLSSAHTAVSCMDDPVTKNLKVVRSDGAKAIAEAPDFGGYSGLSCALWPYKPTGHPQAITAAASPPIVVVGSTGDPATPYADAQALAKQLKHGMLVTRVGNGHTGYMFSQCVRNSVDSYLIASTVPAPGTSCPSP